ncbi:hypothetical protein RZS08_03680, partial [Arthrospira platensis SPKY1]|nr:hypothetical protein [Arthrospira platensis SPKY1]
MALSAWSARFLSIPSHVWAAALLFVLLSMLAWVTRGVAVPGAWPIERAQVSMQGKDGSDAPD